MDLLPSLFVDLDLPQTCKNKAVILRNQQQLASVVFGTHPFDRNDPSPSIHTEHYILEPIDLTDLVTVQQFFSTLSHSLPTLFLSECVLVYIDPDSIHPTLQEIQRSFPNSLFVVYEQIRPNDPFGAMMIRNLHVELEERPICRSVGVTYLA